MIALKPIDTTGYSKKTIWCGPSALSLLTGRSLVDTTQMLTRIRQQPYNELSGVWPEELVIALHELGYRADPIDIIGRFPDTTCGPTLKRFFNERQPYEVINPVLVEVDGHVLVTHVVAAGDNWTGKMVLFENFPKPGRLVKKAFVIVRRNT